MTADSAAILKEFRTLSKRICKDTNNQASIEMIDEDIRKYRLTLSLRDGLWKGFRLKFSIKLPDEYPTKPPIVLAEHTVIHPNIDEECFDVCLNMITDEWDQNYRISHVVQGMLFLFFEPNFDDPMSEPITTVFHNGGDSAVRELLVQLMKGEIVTREEDLDSYSPYASDYPSLSEFCDPDFNVRTGKFKDEMEEYEIRNLDTIAVEGIRKVLCIAAALNNENKDEEQVIESQKPTISAESTNEGHCDDLVGSSNGSEVSESGDEAENEFLVPDSSLKLCLSDSSICYGKRRTVDNLDSNSKMNGKSEEDDMKLTLPPQRVKQTVVDKIMHSLSAFGIGFPSVHKALFRKKSGHR